MSGALGKIGAAFGPDDDSYIAIADLEPLKMTKLGQHKDSSHFELSSLISFSEDDLIERTLEVRDAKLFWMGSPLDTSGSHILYVMGTTGEIIADYEDAGINHGSLAGRTFPIAAGRIKATNGVPKEGDEASGHFAPNNRIQYVVQQLMKKGVEFPTDFKMLISPHPIVGDDERIDSSELERLDRLKELLLARGSKTPVNTQPRSSPSPSPSSMGQISPALRRVMSTIPHAAAGGAGGSPSAFSPTRARRSPIALGTPDRPPRAARMSLTAEDLMKAVKDFTMS